MNKISRKKTLPHNLRLSGQRLIPALFVGSTAVETDGMKSRYTNFCSILIGKWLLFLKDRCERIIFDGSREYLIVVKTHTTRLPHIARSEDNNIKSLRHLVDDGVGGVSSQSSNQINRALIEWGEDRNVSILHSWSLWCCFALAIAVFWHRRRQYDQRGMHKKIEGDAP